MWNGVGEPSWLKRTWGKNCSWVFHDFNIYHELNIWSQHNVHCPFLFVCSCLFWSPHISSPWPQHYIVLTPILVLSLHSNIAHFHFPPMTLRCHYRPRLTGRLTGLFATCLSTCSLVLQRTFFSRLSGGLLNWKPFIIKNQSIQTVILQCGAVLDFQQYQ